MEQRGGPEVDKGSKMEPDGAKRSKMEAWRATFTFWETIKEAKEARYAAPGGRRGGTGRQF